MSENKVEELQELELRQIYEEYKDMWVAMIVTRRDNNFQPLGGKVVANEVDRYRLRLKIVKYDDICIFFAGEPPYPLLI
jgi:hypothetical protein